MTHTKTSVTKGSTLSPKTQRFGENPVKQRQTGNYAQEYIKGFVDKWDELIDWESRASAEGDFFIRTLKAHQVKKVLDVATGTGFHSIRLLEAGFEVVSADGSPEMLVKAFENARQRGHILRTVQADWRWLNRDVHGEYDAIICLGNSFTHMFDERDRRKALAEYYAMLKHDGILILDQRNYDSILDNGFSTKHTYYYCGENVKAEPEHVDSGLARFRYDFPDASSYYLNMFPLRKEYTRRLMQEVGFQKVETFGDFQETYHDEEPDFFIHVAEKAYDSLASLVSPANSGDKEASQLTQELTPVLNMRGGNRNRTIRRSWRRHASTITATMPIDFTIPSGVVKTFISDGMGLRGSRLRRLVDVR